MYKKQKLILAPGLQDRITQSDFFLKSSLTENVKESIFEPVIYSGDRRNNFASCTRLGGIDELSSVVNEIPKMPLRLNAFKNTVSNRQ